MKKIAWHRDSGGEPWAALADWVGAKPTTLAVAAALALVLAWVIARREKSGLPALLALTLLSAVVLWQALVGVCVAGSRGQWGAGLFHLVMLGAALCGCRLGFATLGRTPVQPRPSVTLRAQTTEGANRAERRARRRLANRQSAGVGR